MNKKLSWTTGVREVKDLLPWKENPRKISRVGMEKLKEKIIQSGFHSVIVIDTDNTIISGNQRKTALIQLGIKQVNVLIPDRKLSDEERRKIAIESNINDGEWDFEKLKSFDLGLLQFTGFDQKAMTKIIPNALVNTMIKDRSVRTSITKDSFLYFFHFYYAHYVKYETADFQKEIIHNLEKSSTENMYVVAFRGSGKSTMVTTAYPIWAILGKQQKKFCIIFCQTRAQAKQHMMNIRTELEGNDVLKKDLGPFQEESDEWGSFSLVFKKHGARITVASSEQSIRGIRHNEHRPDLIICDDVEDVQSTKTREGRDKTYNWLRGEVIPAGDKSTRLIIVGNLLHEDSLLMRIKDEISKGKAKGIFSEYPLLDRNNKCLWSGKYGSEKEIEDEKLKVSSDVSWQREYLLRIIPDDDQVIYPEWINYYDELPGEKHNGYRGTYAGVDLAISASETADDTAVVFAHIYSRREKMRIYILPNPIAKKLNFPAQVDLMKDIRNTLLTRSTDQLFVESVAYQEALPQMLEHQGVKATAIKPKGDKRTRLALTSTAIKSSKILFPRQGCERLIEQLVGFGVEKHDDLADAFSLLINSTMDKHSKESTWLMYWMGDEEPLYFRDYVDMDIKK